MTPCAVAIALHVTVGQAVRLQPPAAARAFTLRENSVRGDAETENREGRINVASFHVLDLQLSVYTGYEIAII